MCVTADFYISYLKFGNTMLKRVYANNILICAFRCRYCFYLFNFFKIFYHIIFRVKLIIYLFCSSFNKTMSDKTSLIKSKNNDEKSKNYGAIVATETNTSLSSSQSSIDSSKNQSEMPLDLINTSTINLYEKLGFGLGHVYNDLCAGVWFSYTLLFMQGALRMAAPLAGALVMLGQVGDAIATPIVGYLADKYGTKRQWHLFGTSLIFATFPMIFSLCPACDTAPKWWQPTYFGIIILIFQFGWAIVQITHLAMIPEMSRTQKDRSDLTSIRYSASVMSSVVVFMVTWAVLHARNKTDSNIGPADAYRFRVRIYFFWIYFCFQDLI